MSKFKTATRGDFAPTITLNPDSDSIASGKANFIGNRIVGILLSRKEVSTAMSAEPVPVYEIALYKNPEDETKFGSKPDGEVVSIWGGDTVLRQLMEEGNDGAEIPVGACVDLSCNGRVFGKSGFAKSKGYIDYSIGFFIPAAKFSKANVTSTNAAKEDQFEDKEVETDEEVEDIEEEVEVKKPAKKAPKSSLEDLGL